MSSSRGEPACRACLLPLSLWLLFAMPDFVFAIKAESNHFEEAMVRFTSPLSSDDTGQWSKALVSQADAQHMRLAGQSSAPRPRHQQGRGRLSTACPK